MSKIKWALRVEHKFANEIINLRHLPDVRVCEATDGDYVWATGSSSDELTFQKHDLLFRSITNAIRYRVAEEDRLIRLGERLPSAELPQGPWQILTSYVTFDLPVTSLVGIVNENVDICFQRGLPVMDLQNTQPTLLRCCLAAFHNWGNTAPQTRLNRLTFACNAKKEIIVRGNPLPPIRGARWIEHQNVAVPVGWSWQPRISVQALNNVFKADEHELILVEEDGCWQRIDRRVFVNASRIAIRMTNDQVDSNGPKESQC